MATPQKDSGSARLPDMWRVPFGEGYSVIPLLAKSKVPAIKLEPYKTVRADAETVAKWAAGNYNVGIATGKVSGLIVLDLDSDEAIFEAAAKGLPDTIAVQTARGRHYYFQHPGGKSGNRVRLFPGTDIRGDGGYVVAPGSEHKSGAFYEWLNPPGSFYRQFKLTDEVEFTYNWDFNSFVKHPSFDTTENAHTFVDVPFFENAVLVCDVRRVEYEINDERLDSLEFVDNTVELVPYGWTVFPLFSRKNGGNKKSVAAAV